MVGLIEFVKVASDNIYQMQWPITTNKLSNKCKLMRLDVYWRGINLVHNNGCKKHALSFLKENKPFLMENVEMDIGQDCKLSHVDHRFLALLQGLSIPSLDCLLKHGGI